MRLPVRCLRAAAPLSLALALGSCGAPANTFAPACPIPGLVRPLTDLTRYQGSSRDFRDLVVRARIVDVTGTCEPGDGQTTVVTVQVVVDVSRGPAMQGDAIGLPVFVAVADSGQILDKTEFLLPVEFVHNVDAARAASKEVRMELPTSPQKTAAAYQIIGGFQLTPQEVVEWRRNNTR
jgi:hypothetical protein